HVNIVVTDLERAGQFYGDVLGLKKSFEKHLKGEWLDRVTGLKDAEADCVFYEFPDGKTRIELIQYRGDAAPLEANRRPNTIGVRHFAFDVSDLDAFIQRLRDHGTPVFSDPVTVPFPVGEQGLEKRICYFTDPDGVLLEVAEYR
ncbi:MAG: VOC family protein, partial [Verrucomicrobiota bacterium]